jgi:hypothetical protein
MRNWFVGNLFFIGCAMLLMRGFSLLEDILLDIAGIAAPLVALNPMRWGTQLHPRWNVHLVSAVTFFLAAGCMCLFCSRKTLPQLPPASKSRKRCFEITYLALGIGMLAGSGGVFLLMPTSAHLGFWLEAVGVGTFGAYWLVKTYELSLSDMEAKVLRGEFHVDRTTHKPSPEDRRHESHG